MSKIDASNASLIFEGVSALMCCSAATANFTASSTDPTCLAASMNNWSEASGVHCAWSAHVHVKTKAEQLAHVTQSVFDVPPFRVLETES